MAVGGAMRLAVAAAGILLAILLACFVTTSKATTPNGVCLSASAGPSFPPAVSAMPLGMSVWSDVQWAAAVSGRWDEGARWDAQRKPCSDENAVLVCVDLPACLS